MTGFGTGSAVFGAGRVVAEVRSVNQRFLDVRSRMPRELADLTMFAEQLVRERLRRGRVDLAVRFEGGAIAATLDAGRARDAFAALGRLRDELAPGAELPLGLLATVPELWSSSAVHDAEGLRAALAEAVGRALDATEAMSKTEGAALATDLATRADRMREVVAAVASRAEAARAEAKKRVRDRVEAALEAARASVEAHRLEAEIVLLVERGDVTEELTRLRSHLDQLTAAVGAGQDGPVGRRVEFVLQEMGREVNTIGSKAQDAQLAALVVDIKVELERMREQIQNVE